MSAPIVLPIYNNNSGSSYGITLRNSQVARPFNIPSLWTRIRLGLVFSFTTGSSANPSGTPRFTIGFCSGSNLYGDVNCGHFAGLQNNGVMSWNSQSAYFYHGYDFTVVRAIKKVAGVETAMITDIETGTNYTPSENWRNSGPRNSVWFVDLQRPTGSAGSGSVASGSYTIYWTRHTTYSAGGNFIFTDGQFLSEMVSTSPGTTIAQLTTLTGTPFCQIDEINNGYFDRVYIGWDRENPDPELKIQTVALSILQ